MSTKDLPIVVVLCSGYSGSRLLTRILDDNGIYMGRFRRSIGEDEAIWGRFTWAKETRRAFMHYVLREEIEPLASLVETCFDTFQKSVFQPTLMQRLRERAKRILRDPNAYERRLPKNVRGYGFKSGTGLPYLATPLHEVLKTKGLEQKTYFIHLTRGLGDWLQSGYAKGSKGIPRPLFLPYINYFFDDFIKYLWFASVDQDVELKDTNRLNVLYASSDDLLVQREYLESLLWANTQLRCMALAPLATHYIHIGFENIVREPVVVSKRLSDFLGIDIQIKQQLDPSRVVAKPIPENVSTLARDVSKQLGYE